MGIHTYLTKDHRDCDDFFADLEQSVANRDWTKAKEEFKKFRDETELHFQKEERVLFPAFEDFTGSSEGPTYVMKAEHNQIRGALRQMEADLQNEEADHFLGLSETFNILIQQHNMKEEQILYTMSDQALASKSEKLISDMNNLTLENGFENGITGASPCSQHTCS